MDKTPYCYANATWVKANDLPLKFLYGNVPISNLQRGKSIYRPTLTQENEESLLLPAKFKDIAHAFAVRNAASFPPIAINVPFASRIRCKSHVWVSISLVSFLTFKQNFFTSFVFVLSVRNNLKGFVMWRYV